MIRKEDINGNTPLKVLLQYLDEAKEDKCSRELLSDFEQGKNAGFFEAIDLIRSLCGK